MSADISMLAEVPLFALMDETERESLCNLLEVQRFEQGRFLFEFGDHGDALYILRTGKIEVYIENFEGKRIVLREMGPGEVCGDISLLDDGPRTANAMAMEACECLALDREGLLELVSKHPHAALDLLTVMGRRLRATNLLLRDQVTRNVNEEADDRLTFGQRIADQVASFGGSWTFIIIFAAFMSVWMSINAVMGDKKAFDPYPFILLNLALSALAALQAPVIMMSQNRQGEKDRLKADADFEVNLKAEMEVAHLHSKVDRIYESIQWHFAQSHGAKPESGSNLP